MREVEGIRRQFKDSNLDTRSVQRMPKKGENNFRSFRKKIKS